MDREAQALLDKYGFHFINASVMIDNYDFEERKLIEIVKATYFDPKVLVIDETTTALSQSGRDELYKHMNRLKDEGNTVIFITHDLAEVIKYTDTISVLRDGELIDTVKSGDVSEDDLKRLMVGRVLDDHYYRTDYGETVSDEVVLSAKNVMVPGQLKNISFELHKGEILGIGGLSECGMHEVGKAVFGASYDRTGKVTLANGTPIHSITSAIKHSIAYVSKDRDNESLVINDTICDNICLPSMESLEVKHILLSKKLHQFADKYARLISVKMVGVSQFVSDLSGGNKQKVALARWIGKDSDIVVLDSPTRGIDVKVKADIYALMSKMKKQGKSIIVISEEILELLGMCDRVLVMKDGSISGEFMRNPALTEEDFIAKMV
jgi:ribose transport system ATP-binding protein